MFSRTSLVAPRASCRSMTRSLVRTNSTNSGPTAPAASSATPKRSIPRAAAFADLLAPKAPKGTQSSKASGVGLASLGDDQFDGLIRISKPSGLPRDSQQKDSRQRIGQQNNDQRRVFRPKLSFTSSPRQVTVDGIAVQIPQRTSSHRGSDSQPRDNRNGNRNNDDKARQGQRNRPLEGKSVEGAQQGRKGQAEAAGKRQRTGSVSPTAKEATTPGTLEDVLQPTSPLSTTKPSPSAKSLQPRPRPAAKRVDSVALAKLFDITLTGPTEIVRPPSTSFTLVGTPTILEQQAGDYSRYLDKTFIDKYTRSPKLGPVDYARFTLAKRSDVSLEEKAKAVRIVSTAAGADGAGARAAVRA